jgi:RNA-binding protein
MQKKTKKELKGLGNELKATIHIGKDGVTEGLVEEVKNQIKANKMVKVKVLASTSEFKKEMAAELAEKANLELVEIRGNTVLLCDKRICAKKPSRDDTPGP